MGDVGTFPFGWVRGFKGENWQIIWDPKTELIIAYGAESKSTVKLGSTTKWMDAKVCADNVMKDPESFFE
ncbi:MAG: hypothetical protein DHS20C13_24000 [Thermodesulfobacteriota bacterium]|nr:MAG: hypothetical protein DHS20C13_24000 [Thermodesulfobacteriota bacterium]